MPYRPLWDEDEQWLPPAPPEVAPPFPGAAPVVTPRFATPPFLPPGPPPMAPPPPPARPAFDALAASVGQQPMRTDPALAPSKTRRILGGLAGAALGAGAGFVNASGRARVDPGGGAALADGIVNAKFNRANREFGEQQGKLKAQADIEQARITGAQKEAESAARVGAAEATKTAAEARAAKASAPTPMKPVVAGGTVIDPTTGRVIYKPEDKPAATPQTIDQYINQVSLDPTITKEVKQDLIQKRIDLHNQAHPEKAITKVIQDDNGNLTAVTVSPSQVAKSGGRMDLGSGGKTSKKVSSGGAVTPGASTQDTATVDAIIHGTASLKDVPIKRREYISGLVDKRRGEMGPNLSKGEKGDLIQAETTERLIDEVLAYEPGGLEGIGPVAGRFGAARTALTGGGSDEAKNVRQLIGNIRGTITKLRAGTALSKTEKAQLDTYVPDINTNSTDAISKLNGLKNYLGILKSTTLKYGARDQSTDATPPTPPTVVTGGEKKVGDVRLGKDGKKYRIVSIKNGVADVEPVP